MTTEKTSGEGLWVCPKAQECKSAYCSNHRKPHKWDSIECQKKCDVLGDFVPCIPLPPEVKEVEKAEGTEGVDVESFVDVVFNCWQNKGVFDSKAVRVAIGKLILSSTKKALEGYVRVEDLIKKLNVGSYWKDETKRAIEIIRNLEVK